MFGIGSVFRRLKMGAYLTVSSTKVLAGHPRLLVFPFVSTVASIAFLFAFLGPLFAFDSLVDYGGVGGTGVLLGLFALYVVLTFVATFCNAALVHATGKIYTGEQPSVVESFRAVTGKAGIILVWALIASIVGVLIQVIEERLPFGGRLVAALFSAGWTIATFFVVPVIVFEETSVGGMFQRSAETFKQTWSESLGGLGIGLFFGLFVVLIVAAVVTVPVVVFPNVYGVTTALAGGLVVAVIGGLAYSAIWGVLKTALYGYAKTGEVPDGFETLDFDRLG